METAVYKIRIKNRSFFSCFFGKSEHNFGRWFDDGGGISVDTGRYDTQIEENPTEAKQCLVVRMNC